MTSLTQVDFGVNRKYYIFLVSSLSLLYPPNACFSHRNLQSYHHDACRFSQFFLGSFIGGALFNQFNQWVDNPTSAVTILGTAAPLTSIFFLTYIQLQAGPYYLSTVLMI